MAASIIIVILLWLSWLFSAAELAIMWVPHYKITRSLRNDPQNKWRKLVANLRKKPERTIITILIGNNLVNVIVSLYAGNIGDQVIQKLAITWAMGFLVISIAITFLILFFGEILPKVFANNAALTTAKYLSPLIYSLSMILFPIVISLEFIVSNIRKLAKTKEDKVSREDVEIFVEEWEKQGIFSDIESLIIKNLMDFRETSVEAVFKHRTEIFAIDWQSTLQQSITQILKKPYSRIPVYQWDKDNIIGLVTLRDMLTRLNEYDENTNITDLPIKEISKVPITASIFDIFITMKKDGQHMAIVVDEYGGTAGLVTFEDILESMVWDIKDETDTHEEQELFRISTNKIIAKSDVILRDILHHFKINSIVLPEDLEDYINEEAMISSILLQRYKTFPRKWDMVDLWAISLEVHSTINGGQKIEKVLITKNKD